MPTIELTRNQIVELREAIIHECDTLDIDITTAEKLGGSDDPDAIAYRHSRSVLSDILELLEIA